MKYINIKNTKNQENLHINEDFLDDLNYDSYDEEDPISSTDDLNDLSTVSDDSFDSLLNNVNIKRAETCGLDLRSYEDKIMEWIRNSGMFKGMYKEDERDKARTRGWGSIAVINNDGTIDAYGNVHISGLKEFPEYIYFNKIYAVTEGGINIPGNFTVRNCKFETLPDGFPEEVEGNYSLFRLPNLKSLKNIATSIDGTLEIVMCDNLTDFTNGIKKLGKSVLYIGKDDISTNDILNASYFKPNKKVDQLVKESIVYKNQNMLNEAFNSDILKQLFSMPENKNALAKIKEIPILWSSLSDLSIFPCYGLNNVFSEHKKRADMNSFGLSILCDKNNVIKFIITGADKSEQWADSKLLYADDSAIQTILDNNKALRRLSSSSTLTEQEKEGLQKSLKAAHVDTSLPYDYSLIYKSVYYIRKHFEISMLKYAPSECVRCYICKSSKLGDYEFTYLGDKQKRYDVQSGRASNVFGMYITKTKNFINSPLYKKYIKYLIDDNMYKNINLMRYDRGLIAQLAKNVKNSVTIGAEKVRRKMVSFYNNNTISGDLLDLIYEKFAQCDVSDVIKECNNAIKDFNDIKSINVSNRDAVLHSKDYSTDGVTREKLKNTFANSADYGSYRRFEFLHDAFITIRRLALLLSALEAYEYGDYESFSEDRLNALFKNQAI